MADDPVIQTRATLSQGAHPREAGSELRASEEQFALLVQSVMDYAIFMLDPTGRVVSWNVGAQRIKGYLAHEIIGKHFSTFYTPEDIRKNHPQEELRIALEQGRYEEEGWRIRKDGSRFWANVVITRITDQSGKHIGFGKVTRDLTERKRLEERLRQTNEELDRRVAQRTAELEAAIKAREEFLSICSHELRTPITSIKLQAQAVARRIQRGDPQAATSENYLRFVTAADRQLARLNRLIDDMLNVSRIAAGHLTLDYERVDLRALVDEVAAQFREDLAAAQCPLEIAGESSLWLDCDPVRIEQVIVNLLQNARKYGPGKPIRIELDRSGSEARLTIRDEGRGIAPEDHERIFRRFERAVSADVVSGLGLGLFICKQIVTAHQGRITVESELGKGTAFTVMLPSTAPRETP